MHGTLQVGLLSLDLEMVRGRALSVATGRISLPSSQNFSQVQPRDIQSVLKIILRQCNDRLEGPVSHISIAQPYDELHTSKTSMHSRARQLSGISLDYMESDGPDR